MTDKLRETIAALQADDAPTERECGYQDAIDEVLHIIDTRAALAAAPQPAPETVPCCICFKPCVTAEDGGPECELRGGIWTCSRECYAKHPSVVEADALLARGLRLPGDAEAERDAAFAAGQASVVELLDGFDTTGWDDREAIWAIGWVAELVRKSLPIKDKPDDRQ